ncbi:MAG: hypothetical protein ABR909_13500 [Candidatus Bathyarchaeia archaeon]
MAPDQGYAQDANNFYVWFTTQFSTHQVTIQFAVPPMPSAISLGLVLAIVITVAAIILIFIVIAIRRRRRKPETPPKPDSALPKPETPI